MGVPLVRVTGATLIVVAANEDHMGGPTRRELLAGVGTGGLVAGAAAGPSGASRPTRTTDGFATDFDHPASRLDGDGWTVEYGSFRTADSSLVADGGARNLDYQLSRPQESAAGTFELRGARNEHPFYGLRFQFVSDVPTFGEPPVAGGDQRGYQLVLANTQNGGPVELTRTDENGAETLLTLTEDHGGESTDVRIERDPGTWKFHCYLDGEHVGSVTDDRYTTSSYWVQKHGAGDSQRVDGLAIESGPTDGSAPVETPEASADWLDGWYPLVAWLVGVPVLGPLALAGLVAADRRLDERGSADPCDSEDGGE